MPGVDYMQKVRNRNILLNKNQIFIPEINSLFFSKIFCVFVSFFDPLERIVYCNLTHIHFSPASLCPVRKRFNAICLDCYLLFLFWKTNNYLPIIFVIKTNKDFAKNQITLMSKHRLYCDFGNLCNFVL